MPILPKIVRTKKGLTHRVTLNFLNCRELVMTTQSASWQTECNKLAIYFCSGPGTGNKNVANLWRKIMSILKLRASLVEKIKDFGNSIHPVLKKPFEELSLPIKKINYTMAKILSIDDNKICQKINVNQLQKFGCTVECVNSARSALEKLTSSYQIILLDVHLPDCSIDVLINLIRSDEGNVNQKIPIILTSSWLNESFKKNYLALDVDEVYVKPIQENDFKKILQNCGVIS